MRAASKNISHPFFVSATPTSTTTAISSYTAKPAKGALAAGCVRGACAAAGGGSRPGRAMQIAEQQIVADALLQS